MVYSHNMRVSLSRLCRLYPPREILEAFGMSVGLSMECAPVGYQEEGARTPAYHKRRVAELTRHVMDGGHLDPISIIGHEDKNLPIELTDGHHRLLACWYAGLQTIEVRYRGPKSTLNKIRS